jgi:hypothetical protein
MTFHLELGDQYPESILEVLIRGSVAERSRVTDQI